MRPLIETRLRIVLIEERDKPMKIARARIADATFFGVIEGDSIRRINGDPFSVIGFSGESYELCTVELLAPVVPSKIVAIGVNYADHASELSLALPPSPLIFLKPPTSVIGPGDEIVYPAMSARVDYEAELGIVIGRRCKDISLAEAMDYVLGFTCVNDVTARDLQQVESQWTRCKGFDTFCPIGPWIETEFDYLDKAVIARLNGQVMQSGRTSQMINKVDVLVSFISKVMTLLPGDVIASGTPSGIGPMERGSLIEIEVEGIGVLKNTLR